MDTTFFKSAAEFREWLEGNHDKAQELWVGFYKKNASEKGITYPEAVDQALCFGWIDGIRKTLDENGYVNRFTPRKARSNWSAVNIKRVGELSEMGLMHPAGLKAFNERHLNGANQYSYEERSRELDEAYQNKLKENQAAWDFFQSQAPYYRKTASWWVMSAKREETRLKRLATLIEDSENGRRITAVTYQGKEKK